MSILGEREAEEEIRRFVRAAVTNINELTAEELVQNAAINPFLVKALGIDDFESLARFYVYQRIGRSLVTSFGTTIEKIIRALARGKKSGWWDVKATINSLTYYMSVKSGPRDMNKDQVELFAKKARELQEVEPNIVLIIAMGYGKKPFDPIAPTLEAEGFDPDMHTLTGKKLYEVLTGQTDYHKKLLELISDVATQTLGNRKIIELIENKTKEVAEEFSRKYPTVDALLLDTF
jgi:hypothetical protein